MLFIATKKENKFTAKQFNDYIKQLKDGKYTIEVKKWQNNRTNNQNNYYWMYLTIISDETGEDRNDLHELFKRKFLPPVYKQIFGKEYKFPSSTTKLNKQDFSEYIMKIEILTGIPAPNTQEYL
jgi:dTDP-4-amino-4,6-dideoxygalactose transaminase